ncbi:ArsR/SmtB family transcription factor [Peribacillus frigoritolerans]|uniref:ArsR/SmtB family transcription factor n=1 Tax=Peribacillus frigoritolerans TaxID=450367 RepID=UPI0010597938|nr:metalloregulator ArsR/SmtB family transcription factor [Peribacillus frigoritolerans]TDL82095.1 ArsR family transcriptional regulator [Peribacillus frigoritolerans]
MQTSYFSEEEIEKLTKFMQAMSDPTRLKILSLLHAADQNVSDIVSKLDISQSAVSHQLKILKNAQLVNGIRVGQTVRYSLVNQLMLERITEIIKVKTS